MESLESIEERLENMKILEKISFFIQTETEPAQMSGFYLDHDGEKKELHLGVRSRIDQNGQERPDYKTRNPRHAGHTYSTMLK
jgi:hypothetical protein